MNFFEQQEKARRHTRLLVFLFIIAVACLIFITLAFLVLFPWQTTSQSFSDGSNQPLVCLLSEDCDFWVSIQAHSDKLLAVGLVMTVFIGGVSLFKWFSLRKGGCVIAEMLGGRELAANTRNMAEQRLLNIVEEMAIASNMPVPSVYVLDGEPGINAFAAGFSTKDAIVAVTEGALHSFNRDQMQGVIAHEFSHILNGDMRLNMQMIAVLHGIMFISEMGYVFLRSNQNYNSVRSHKTFMEYLLGFGLVAIGSLGTLFGNLIKAAVSRQREFLADASAVQFTRNPSGIADALKVIGGANDGSLILDAYGGEVSHLFFGEALTRAQGFFATHPSLDDRIRRIEPRWDGEFLQPSSGITVDDSPEEEKPPIEFDAVMAAVAVAANTIAQIHKPSIQLGEELHQPLGAAAAICSLLLHNDESHRNLQEQKIKASWPKLYDEIVLSPWRFASGDDFLPIVNLSTSALRMLTVDEYKQFKQLLLVLMQADGKIDIYEWSLYYTLKSALDCHFGHAILPQPRYKKIADIEPELRLIIRMSIQSTKQNEQCKERALQRAFSVCDFIYSVDDLTTNVTMAQFTAAMKKLGNAFPLLKARVLKALIAAAKTDGEIEQVERQVILAVSAAIDSPVFDLDMPGTM